MNDLTTDQEATVVALREFHALMRDNTKEIFIDTADIMNLLTRINELGFDVVIIFGSSVMIGSASEENPYFNRFPLDEETPLFDAMVQAVEHFVDWYFD